MAKYIRNVIIVLSVLLLIATMWVPASAARAKDKHLSTSRGNTAAGPAYQNELLVLGAIKKIYAAEHQYLFDVTPPAEQPGPSFGTLKQLQEAGLIDPVLGSGEKFGYNFHIITLGRGSASPPNIIVNAWPKVYRKTGVRSFFMNIDCGIKGADRGGAFAEWTDPVIESCSPTIAYAYGTQSMADLRVIVSAEFTYAATAGNGHFATLDQLHEAGMIDDRVWYSDFFTYHYVRVTTIKPTLTTPAAFKIWSTPTVYLTSGVLSLFIDDTGVLRGSDRGGQQAHEDDPPIMLNTARYNNES
jgi:hypothetical protein